MTNNIVEILFKNAQKHQEKLAIIHNVSSEEASIELSKLGEGMDEICEIIGMGSAHIDGENLTVGPQTSIIIN